MPVTMIINLTMLTERLLTVAGSFSLGQDYSLLMASVHATRMVVKA